MGKVTPIMNLTGKYIQLDINRRSRTCSIPFLERLQVKYFLGIFHIKSKIDKTPIF